MDHDSEPDFLYSDCQENPALYGPFKLPIEYLDESSRHPLSDIVCQDLELVDTRGANHSMYQFLFQPSHPLGDSMISEWKRAFTSDVAFLKDTQQIVQEMTTCDLSPNPMKYESIMQLWGHTKEDDYFLEKHNYVEWDVLESLNRSSSFLQILFTINMLSPAISLIFPFIMLIVPFIILKIRGVPITFPLYFETLQEIAKHHFLGKALLNLRQMSADKMIYLVFLIGLYFYQIYQNLLLCSRFYHNILKINDDLCNLSEYLDDSIRNMQGFVELHSSKKTYREFCKTITSHSLVLGQFRKELGELTPTTHIFTKLSNIGHLLKCYYVLHANVKYENSIRYSFGFEGFLDNLRGINRHVISGAISPTKYNTTKKCKLIEQYYPASIGSTKCVKNTCDLKKKNIITGPNASGKTTFLKTTTINIIFSQQIGFGFYKACRLNPYTHIHSYLNIPDTSERDSLFQAESRRCKEIIEIIGENRQNNSMRHYCIFDELYSGTNPSEATLAAHAFMKYLSEYENVDYILTTHYVSICRALKHSKKIKNYKMEVVPLKNGKYEYTYRIKSGISNIKGAIQILEDMNYPKEILDDMRAS